MFFDGPNNLAQLCNNSCLDNKGRYISATYFEQNMCSLNSDEVLSINLNSLRFDNYFFLKSIC